MENKIQKKLPTEKEIFDTLQNVGSMSYGTWNITLSRAKEKLNVFIDKNQIYGGDFNIEGIKEAVKLIDVFINDPV